jgi:hypothetical protein
MKTRKLNINTPSGSRWLKVEESRDNKIPIRLQPFTIYSGHVSGIQDSGHSWKSRLWNCPMHEFIREAGILVIA